jgi:putative ABC transport system permease protein
MLETLKFTGRIMKKRPLRSLLTIFQLALGVWIVAVILSLNLQATSRINEAAVMFGDTLAKVHVSKEEQVDGAVDSMRTSTFQRSDLERLKESSNIEAAFIYDHNWYMDMQFNNLYYRVGAVAGTTPEFADAVGLEMVEGYFFTDMDLEQNNRVAVISETISKQLYPNQSALGQTINLGRFREGELIYEIIGVYKPPVSSLQYFLQESYVIFPLGYSDHYYEDMDWERTYGEIYIQSAPGAIYDAVEDAKILLAHRAVDGMEVNGEYFQDSTRFQTTQIKNMSMMLGAFAFVAIMISSIGILSIMLVSVVERTREIGLRKALGASKLTIVAQILNESFVFSLLGAFVGLIAAYFTSGTLTNTLAEEIFFYGMDNLGGLHPKAALFAFLLAIVVGQLFGLYPAVQAAKMLPVDALRDA